MADTLVPGAGGVPAGAEVPPAPSAVPPTRPHPRLVTWAGVVVGAGIVLVLVAPAFGGRPPAGEDVMAHLVRADFAIPELVARGRLDGWFPRFFLGHQEFLFNGPGLVWLMALLRGATFGLLSNTGALKVISLGSAVAVVPAAWFLARSFGLSRRSAGLGAALSTCVSNPFGLGLQGLFNVGLIPHQVGALFFCLALGACLRMLDDPRIPWRVLAASALAGLAVIHLISSLVLAVMLGLCLVLLGVMRGLSWRGLGRLAGTGVAAAGLAAFWLVPLAAHRDLRGIVTTWGTPPFGERLGDIARGDILLPTGAGALAVVAAAYLLWRRRRLPIVLGLLPFAYLGVAHGALSLLGGNEVTLQLTNRGLGYAGLLGLLGVAALVGGVTARLGTPGHLGALAAVAAVAFTAAPGRNAPGELDEPVPPMRAAAFALAQLVPDGARFATQRDFPGEIGRTGVIHPETWLARVSGRNSLNGFNLESSNTPIAALAPDTLDDSGPRSSARRMSRFGVTHVVTTGQELFDRLSASGRFQAVWRDPPLAILEVRPDAGQPGPASLLSSSRPLTARLTGTRPEHLRIEIEAREPTQATVSVAWSPKWHAHLNDRPLPIRRTRDNLMAFKVPQGTSRLRLDYELDVYDHVGPAITVLTLGAGGTWLLRLHRRRGEGGRESGCPEEDVVLSDEGAPLARPTGP